MNELPPLPASADRVLLVTGSAGFIGANFVHDWMRECGSPVVSLDKLTYAGNRASLSGLDGDPRHVFIRGDIGDRPLVGRILAQYQPAAIVNFAAETHVDRSIQSPEDFAQTNVMGTLRLLEAARIYCEGLDQAQKNAFRFLHISTDEIYGSLEPHEPAFAETSRTLPNSPYAASKAASDHFVRAYHHTYGLQTLTTHCSNNYGPYQFPEKLIPLMIGNALAGKTLPVYGDGQHVRDWLYVGDHCAALRRVLKAGRAGETYNIGGRCEMKNIDIVHALCDILDRQKPLAAGKSYRAQIVHIKDRPGHDRRYALDARKTENELGWKPKESFSAGIEKTVRWYLDNQGWVRDMTGGSYADWIKTNYESGIRATT